MKQALLKITGQVQGVFFRSNAQDTAVGLNLKGYAKNLPDASVEVLLQGGEADILKFIDWAKEGPPSSKVENVEISWQDPSELIDPFDTF